MERQRRSCQQCRRRGAGVSLREPGASQRRLASTEALFVAASTLLDKLCPLLWAQKPEGQMEIESRFKHTTVAAAEVAVVKAHAAAAARHLVLSPRLTHAQIYRGSHTHKFKVTATQLHPKQTATLSGSGRHAT